LNKKEKQEKRKRERMDEKTRNQKRHPGVAKRKGHPSHRYQKLKHSTLG
jgi:hypothetical protein